MDNAKQQVKTILKMLRGGERIWYRVTTEATIAWQVIDARWLSEHRAEVCISGDDSTWRPLNDYGQLFFESAQLSVTALKDSLLDVLEAGDRYGADWQLYRQPNAGGTTIEQKRVEDERQEFIETVLALVRGRLIDKMKEAHR